MDVEEKSYQAHKGNVERNLNAIGSCKDFMVFGIPKEFWNRLIEELNLPKENFLIEIKPDTREELRKSYNKIRNLIGEYLDIPEEHKTITAIWIIGTYLHEQFETYPYLFFNAMRGSGKTRILKLITTLSKNGQLLMSLTEAVLFRTVGTLGIDEFESMGNKEKQALRELLNAAYKKGVKIIRMKKKKTLDGETQVTEEFEPYRPIVMANIWGIEEVLGDRCISLIMEKSDNPLFTKLIEDFSTKPAVLEIVRTLNTIQCSLCSVVSPRNIITTWNKYINTLYTLTTLTTSNYTNCTKEKKILTAEEEEFCKKIDETGLNGRHLELYFPLFLVAKEIGEDVFEESLYIAKKTIGERKIDELAESKDVLIYKLVANQTSSKFYKIQELTNIFRLIMGEGESDWLNAKWVGRALKRLNLTTQKRRTSDGVEVMLDTEKANKKMEMFK